jgi:hypothetical protein
MGHVLNPISMRLSLNTLWSYNWYTSNVYQYNFMYFEDINLQVFLKKFFELRIFPMNGYLYSHSNIVKFSKFFDVKVYIYKTINELGFNLTDFLKLSNILISFFYKFIYFDIFKKIFILFIFYYHKLYRFIINLLQYKVIILHLLILNIYMFYKHIRFLYFLKIVNFFIVHKYNKLKKKLFYSIFILKLFFWFLKYRFWRNISFFLYFFSKQITNNNIIMRICKLNMMGVSIFVIGSYLVKRLKQRFKVVELMMPIMRTLKKIQHIIGFKFSFCGRFSREEMATAEFFSNAAVSLNTLNLFIEYLLTGVILKDSYCGIKIWLNKKKDLFFDLFFFSQQVYWNILL